MTKKMYLVSLRLFSWHLLFLGGSVGIYRLLVNVVLNTEKLFNVLFITTIFNILALIISFYLAVKIVKKEKNELFEKHHSLLLFLYIINLAILALLVFIFLIVFKNLSPGIFLFGGLILLLYVYYYFLRFIYYISFFGKLRITTIVLVVILILGYSLLLFLPQNNYKKAYNQTEIGADFNYFHKLNLDDIVGNRDLQDKNSAEDLVKLINLLATDEKILDEGEKLSYILPTKVELELLSDISKNIYLNVSEKYLSKEIRQTGGMMVTPLNDLRSFSRGIVKLSEQKKEQGYDDESIEMLNNLLLLGNQMLGVKNDTLISKLVGDSMMRESLGGLGVIYENDDFRVEAITRIIKELDDIRNGQRLLRTAVFHMKDEVVGSSKNTAIFFKHLAAQKHNIGSDFDMELIANNMSLTDGFIVHDSTDLEKFVLSFMVLPIMLPFELNIGNDYIVYRETKKLSKEPGHEMLDYYFKTSYTDFTETREVNRKKAVEVVAEEIFTSRNNIDSKMQGEKIVKENEIYYSENNSEYPLVLNHQVYPANKKPELSEELSDSDMGKLSLTPLMSVPDNSWIFNVATASSSNDVYFVVYSTLAYQYIVHQNSDTLKNPSGGGVTALTAYRYIPDTKTIERLFDTLDFPELVRKYPQIKSVSADGRYVAFDVTPCWGCGGGYPTTFLFDTVRKMRESDRDIGRVLEFQWLNNGNYQYKEFIDRECEVMNTCYQDPANLPLSRGNF